MIKLFSSHCEQGTNICSKIEILKPDFSKLLDFKILKQTTKCLLKSQNEALQVSCCTLCFYTSVVYSLTSPDDTQIALLEGS